MELIRISKRKLKIMLTPTDMCQFELNPDSFGEDSKQMHHAFRLLLEEIRRRTDFDADDHQISVQYFPSREGGCEMFISRLGSEDKKATSASPSEGRALQIRGEYPPSGSFRKDCAYRFESLGDLLSVCRRLRDVGYIGDSSAYRDEKDVYFLFITLRSTSPFVIPDEWNFILEYGSSENAALARLYVLEHASAVCPSSAVNTLACLA